ncbi:MAG TPA: rhomboid family intramembrane serine protease [Baekduia sp.]|uniref:rhomboid family intramembrane serine protease n=1 Tax=Baekduia sp. TaxID=2600305 RepID=UPI002B95DE45|nr:rhomboid family intramembrane serine protease [Baekduia sp.]HMJ37587.1 rhomboid family intramembrane serine protease [Baekduia sp.]
MHASPTTSGSPAVSSDRRRGLLLVGAMSAVMWIEEIADQLSGQHLDQYGIRPRGTDGLIGIVDAPFLHGGFGHLIANTVPFLVLGAIIALSGLARVALVTVIVAGVGGLGVWLLAASGTDHIGASGIVFGYATYLITRGLFSHDLLHLAAGAIVAVVYGSTLLFSVVPHDGVSWQGHLFGGIGGVIAARLLDVRTQRRRLDPAIA